MSKNVSSQMFLVPLLIYNSVKSRCQENSRKKKKLQNTKLLPTDVM